MALLAAEKISGVWIAQLAGSNCLIGAGEFMSLEDFEAQLGSKADEASFEDFCRQKVLHGTPHIFAERDDEFYAFKRRITEALNVHHGEVFVVGSAKLGFSPFKRTAFSLDSDIDLAIVSDRLWNYVLQLGTDFEYDRRSSRLTMHKSQEGDYLRYLRYCAIGWIRPDLIPNIANMRAFKQDWFDFFTSLSYGASEVGNYKVSAGIFRDSHHLEKYTFHSYGSIWRKLKLKTGN